MLPGRISRQSDLIVAYAFLAPALLFLAGFLGYPILDTLYLSFTRYNYVYDSQPTLVGLQNYLDLLQNNEFLGALFNTLAFTGMFLPLFIGGSLLAALALNAVPRFGDLFRTTLLLPIIVGESVSGVMFSWILSKDFGLFNQFLEAIGLGAWTRGWLSDPQFAMSMIVVVELWMLLGIGMLIFLAGLRAISKEIYDAAAVDGAGPMQTLFYVTMPNLRIHFVIVAVWGLVQAIKLFGVPYVMTHGGPAGATETLYLYVWQTAFKLFDMGHASAVGYVIAVLILVCSGVAYLFGRSRKEA